ncbi:MAG: helix-turn-helix domain containing protein [Pseudonocardiales bacterium]|nr:helix-turn-helix domain containing protein [Pseudonocardiales bacterium]
MVIKQRAGRAERAAATRRKVLDAAVPLFVEHGYLETTMAALAAAAGVAVQTLYLSFGSKAAVLEAALAQDQPSGWLDAVAAAPDGPSALERHVTAAAADVARRHPLAAVLRAAAADPDPAALLAAERAAALARHAAAVDDLAERPGFTVEVSLQRATESMAALLAPETYALLVAEQGWTVPDWAEWATRHLRAELFPG